MDKLKVIFLNVIVAVLLLVSCGPMENSYVSDSYTIDVFTVNNGATLTPEFDDTLLRVKNFADFDLQPGERVSLHMHKHFDAYNPKNSYLEIVDLLEKIPTLSIAQREDVVPDGYDLPLGVSPYFYQPSIWVWDNRLNVNALFRAKADATDFVMSLRDIRKDTVSLNLLAKSDEPTETLSAKLLSYNLENIDALFTNEEKEALKGYKKLVFNIYMKNKDKEDKLSDKLYFVEKGEFLNPLYN